MLELSRLESGKIELNNYYVSLSELVEEVIDDFEYELEKKQLHVVKEYEVVDLDCDPIQIERVINNSHLMRLNIPKNMVQSHIVL